MRREADAHGCVHKTPCERGLRTASVLDHGMALCPLASTAKVENTVIVLKFDRVRSVSNFGAELKNKSVKRRFIL